MKLWKPTDNHSDTILESSVDKNAKMYSYTSKISQTTEVRRVKLERQKDELGSDQGFVP